MTNNLLVPTTILYSLTYYGHNCAYLGKPIGADGLAQSVQLPTRLETYLD